MRFVTLTTLLCLLVVNSLTAGELEKANELYQEAVALMKQDHRANAAKTLALLKDAREHFFKAGNLDPASEATLMKLNSHIYWQSKFSNSKQLQEVDSLREEDVASTKTKTDSVAKSTTPDQKKIELEKEKEAKREVFNDDLKVAQDYENKHKDDAMSNMLNYLDLQTKVVDIDKALDLLSKTEHYNAELIQQKDETIAKFTSEIRNFDKLLNAKMYKDIYEQLLKIIRFSTASPQEIFILKNYTMEMMAMNTIKSRLLEVGNSQAIPLPRQYSTFRGVVIDISTKGLKVISEDKVPGFLSWTVLPEETILGLALHVLNDKDSNDLYLLALGNLRLSSYEDSYNYFNELIKINPTNYLKYRDYLSVCETGYRLKYGPKVEQMFLEVKKLSEQGNKRHAIDLLLQFKDDYLNTTLGESYIERFSLVYKDVLRG